MHHDCTDPQAHRLAELLRLRCIARPLHRRPLDTIESSACDDARSLLSGQQRSQQPSQRIEGSATQIRSG